MVLPLVLPVGFSWPGSSFCSRLLEASPVVALLFGGGLVGGALSYACPLQQCLHPQLGMIGSVSVSSGTSQVTDCESLDPPQGSPTRLQTILLI